MFCLSLIEHELSLPPHLLSLPLMAAIKGELEKLFLDKVIANLGLCISVYDIRSIDGGFIVPGDGAPIYKVVFRLVMFRPFVGEILLGKIKASDSSGLHLTLGFFNDVHVPVHLLQRTSIFKDGIWYWNYKDEDKGDANDDDELPMDLNEEIYFRVSNVKYPPIPVDQEENAKPFAPMKITGDICMSGLGLVSWWA